MLFRPMNRRALLRATAGTTAAAVMGGHVSKAFAQGTPADAADVQELRIAAAASAVRLDPHLTYGVSQIGTFTYFMWAGLTKVDGELNAVPDIAASWDVSEDGTVYTFHLDPNRKFSDGSPITAHDVVWSWTRSLDPATASLTTGSYLQDVVGAQEFWQGTTAEPPDSYHPPRSS